MLLVLLIICFDNLLFRDRRNSEFCSVNILKLVGDFVDLSFGLNIYYRTDDSIHCDLPLCSTMTDSPTAVQMHVYLRFLSCWL